jgi:hypothetical protein
MVVCSYIQLFKANERAIIAELLAMHLPGRHCARATVHELGGTQSNALWIVGKDVHMESYLLSCDVLVEGDLF